MKTTKDTRAGRERASSERAEWLLRDNGAEISIPMPGHKGALARSGEEAPLLLDLLNVRLYLSAASPQNRLVSYRLSSCVFNRNVFGGFI